MQDILSSAVGVLGALFLFGFAIFIHELGHFLVAKLSGVGVTKFAIGFGPRITSFVRGGTEYSIRWIPLGGFVALKGMVEDLEEEKPVPSEPSGSAVAENAPAQPEEPKPAVPDKVEKSGGVLGDDLDALRNKNPLIRIAVFVAGVSFNFLTAMVVMGLILYLFGIPSYTKVPNQLEKIPESTHLYELGWRSGDRIVAVAPDPSLPMPKSLQEPTEKPAKLDNLTNWEEVEAAMDACVEIKGSRFQIVNFLLRRSHPDPLPTLGLTVERGGQRLQLPLPLEVYRNEIRAFSASRPACVGGVVPLKPADKARLVKADYTLNTDVVPRPTQDEMLPMPLAKGDEVLQVNGKPVTTWNEMTEALSGYPNQQVDLAIRREGQIYLLTTTLESHPDNPNWGYLGISVPSEERTPISLWEAVSTAPIRTLVYTDRVIYTTVELLVTKSGEEVKKNVAGPVGITVMAYKSAKAGLENYLMLFMSINIMLAIMNLLPIPILDGGYIMITCLETLIRRPVPRKLLEPVMMVFFICFIILFVFLFSNDLVQFIFKS
ncbi:MAG TPA: site-2 protease family protein [Candidatus Sumerlaeota bacterium]|nr:site-2 protease family protein [Candidatus Sumerlaeota bacterium]HPR99953.1 site-2 protease family protein [Candidatus Sumerlaeota bacterium]